MEAQGRQSGFTSSRQRPAAFPWFFWGLLGVFLALLLTLVIIVWWYVSFSRDQFVDYLPLDTVIYVSMRRSFWPWEYQELTALPVRQFDGFFALDAATLARLRAQASHAAIVVLPRNGGTDVAFLFLIPDRLAVKSFLDNEEAAVWLDDQRLLISASAQSREEFTASASGTVFSLGTQVDQRLLGRGLLNVYINAQRLNALFRAQTGDVWHGFGAILAHDIYLTVLPDNGYWQFFQQERVSETGFAAAVSPALGVPDTFVAVLTGVNIFELIDQFARGHENFFAELSQAGALLNRRYGFAPDVVVQALFDQPSTVVITDLGAANSLGFDFVSAVPSVPADALSRFEALLSTMLAYRLPQELSRMLPDGTTVTELVADTDQWRWEYKNFGVTTVRVLQAPRLGFEFAYVHEPDRLVMGSTAALVAQAAANTSGRSVGDLFAACPATARPTSRLALTSQDRGLWSFLPDGLMVLAQDLSGNLHGCLLEND